MKRVLLLVLLSFISFIATAQRYNFKEYNVQDGLIHSTVTTIAEDQRGYLWLGTYDGGISRFDGSSFVNYFEEEHFAGNRLRDIAVDKNGEIWFASSAGLAHFDGTKFNYYTDSTGLITSRVRALLFDDKNQFWIGTTQGINIMKGDSIYEFDHNYLFENRGVSTFMKGRDSTIYIGTWDGLLTYKNGTIDSIETQKTDSLDFIYALKEDSKGNIWIGTHRGLWKYDLHKTATKYEMVGGTASNIIRDIEEDQWGNIWVVTLGGGAFFYDGETFTNITDQNGLNTNALFAVFKDSFDVLWIGGGGINKYFGDAFTHIGPKEGLIHESVFPILEDSKGNIWLGTEGGLSHLNTTTGDIINYVPKGVPTHHEGITSIVETKLGDIWVTTQTGLYKLVNGALVAHPKYNDIELWNIKEDNSGNFWIGTSNGLILEKQLDETLYKNVTRPALNNPSLSNPETVEYLKQSYTSVYYTKINGFADDIAYASEMDSEGNMWFGTAYSGVFKYSNGKFENFTTKDGLMANDIIQLAHDNDGGMWISTSKGLSHYNKNNHEIRSYTSEDGLWMNNIFNVVVDGNNIWIGGSKGIQRLTFNESGDIVDEAKFGKHEGFTSIETNDVGGMKDSKGNLWFGTIKGATVVNPNKVDLKSFLTKIHITDIKLFFEEVDWTQYSDSIDNWYRLPKSLTLPHDKNQLTFEFAGINLRIPEKIQYQWKLEGFDNNWSPPSNKREANYTNIPPGNYTFMVKASNDKGVWSPVPASFSFRVGYPIYQRWWFITLSIMLVISTVWGFISYRLNNIRKITEAKQLALETERKMVESERKALRAQINPHFIFNVLNSIQFYIQDNDPLVASRYLSKFAKLMRMILDNSKYSSVPLLDELEALKLYMDLEVLRSEYKFEYQVEVDDSLDASDSNIPPMLIQPFIENSIRHGLMPSPNKGTLKLMLSSTDGIIKCVIEDNGVGILKSMKDKPASSDHVSSGMKITSDRLELINSQRNNKVNIEIVDLSEVDQEKTGTRVTIYIPVE